MPNIRLSPWGMRSCYSRASTCAIRSMPNERFPSAPKRLASTKPPKPIFASNHARLTYTSPRATRTAAPDARIMPPGAPYALPKRFPARSEAYPKSASQAPEAPGVYEATESNFRKQPCAPDLYKPTRTAHCRPRRQDHAPQRSPGAPQHTPRALPKRSEALPWVLRTIPDIALLASLLL